MLVRGQIWGKQPINLEQAFPPRSHKSPAEEPMSDEAMYRALLSFGFEEE